MTFDALGRLSLALAVSLGSVTTWGQNTSELQVDTCYEQSDCFELNDLVPSWGFFEKEFKELELQRITQHRLPFDLTQPDTLPLAIDLWQKAPVAEGGDGTLVLPEGLPANPFTQGLDQLDGFSTTASLDIPIGRPLAADSVVAHNNVFLQNLQTKALIPIEAKALTLTDGTCVLRLLPKEPLAPETPHLVVLADSLKTDNGLSLSMPETYRLASLPRQDMHLYPLLSLIQQWIQAGDRLLSERRSRADLALAYQFTTGSTDSVLKSIAMSDQHIASQRIDWIDLNPQTTALDGFPLFSSKGDTFTQVFQGQIRLPQGINTPFVSDEPQSPLDLDGVKDTYWRNELGNISAQNPLPSLREDDHAPVMLIQPGDYSSLGGYDCTRISSYPVALFVHGITADRTSALLMGQYLAQNGCIATVVMDHPGHGLAPNNPLAAALSLDPAYVSNGVVDNEHVGVPSDIASGQASPWATARLLGLSAGDNRFAQLHERHRNIHVNEAGERVPFVYGDTPENSTGASGAAFINLLNFGRTRDNLRQAVWDQLTLLASLDDIEINGHRLNTRYLNVVGHSMGAIIGTTLTHLVNDLPYGVLPRIRSLTAANGGAQVTRLLENSPAFRDQVVGGLEHAGLQQGSLRYEQFMQVLQAAADTGDAINYVNLSNTPTLMFEMIGGGEIEGDPALPDALVAAFEGRYPPDHVVPNYDYTGNRHLPFAMAGLNTVIPTAASPLAGTTPLAKAANLHEVRRHRYPQGTRAWVRLNRGTHSTFALADDAQAFQEMAAQTLAFIQQRYRVFNYKLLGN